eukprot:jgi/Galph1/788/GphlegSOOS_G5587.1
MEPKNKTGTTTFRQLDEQQFILRLPPFLAKRLHDELDQQSANHPDQETELPYQIRFIDERHAMFYCDNLCYPATLMDLPCVVESTRLGESKKMYKNLDVHQILQVSATPTEHFEPKPGEDYTVEDGITPVSKGAKTRFRKEPPEYSKERVSNVEGLMKNVFELKLNLVKGETNKKETENIIEFSEDEEELSSEESQVTSNKQPSVPNSPASSFPPVPVQPDKEEHEKESPVGETVKEEVDNLIENENVSGAQQAIEPTEQLTSLPEEAVDQSPEVDAVEQAKVIEAQRKAERFKLEQVIETQLSKIRQMEDKIREVSNRALKQRLQRHLDDLNQELTKQREALEKYNQDFTASAEQS